MGFARGVGYLIEGIKLALTHPEVGGPVVRLFLLLTVAQLVVLGVIHFAATSLLGMGLIAKLVGASVYLLYALASVVFTLVSFIVTMRVSEKVSLDAERLEGGNTLGDGAHGAVGEIAQNVAHSIAAIAIYFGAWIGIHIAGFIISWLPGSAWITEGAITLARAFLVAFLVLSCTFDRRKMSFGAKTAWMFGNFSVVMGFGLLLGICAPIPVLGPAAVTFATAGAALLVVRETRRSAR